MGLIILVKLFSVGKGKIEKKFELIEHFLELKLDAQKVINLLSAPMLFGELKDRWERPAYLKSSQFSAAKLINLIGLKNGAELIKAANHFSSISNSLLTRFSAPHGRFIKLEFRDNFNMEGK